MPLHSGQVRYLRETYHRKTRLNVLVPGNRWGKSSLIACLQLHYLFYKIGIAEGDRKAWFKSEYRTANIAPHSAQTEAVFKAIHQILTSSYAIKTPTGLVTNKCLIEWFYVRSRTINTPPYKQVFANNSYIEHRSLGQDQGDALQGKPYGLITYDEGGRSHHLKSEVMSNIMPRLADWMGPFHLLSTPDKDSPSILYHHELYKNGLAGINSTYTQEGSLRENLLFGAEQIAEQYKIFENDPTGPQVLDGKFLTGGDNLFSIEDIEAAQDEELDDGVLYQEGHSYVIGTDTAMSTDEIVHTVLDTTDLKITKTGTSHNIEGQCRLVRMVASTGNSKSPQQHVNDFIDLFNTYNQNHTVSHMLETWNGESARFYLDLPYEIQAATTCYGSWQPEARVTDNKNKVKKKSQSIKKADILIAAQKLFAAHAIKIFKQDPNRHPDGADLAEQLFIYKEDDKNLPTDRVISLCLAAYLATETTKVQELQFLDF